MAVNSSFELSFERGVAQMQAGRLADALITFDEIVAAQPDNGSAYNNRGIVLARLQRHREALASFDRAIALKPDFPEALRNRGSALAESGRKDEALGSFVKAVEIKPDFGDGWLGLGLLMQDLGRHEEALQCLDRVLALDPSHLVALSKRASVLAILQRYEDALSAFEHLFATGGGSAGAFNECGLALMNLRRPKEALAYFDRALEAQPGFVEALSNRGLALGKLMLFEEGLRALDRALEAKPDHVAALDNRAIMLAKLGRFEESLECHEEALKIRPDFSNAHINQGITRLRLGDFRRGLPSYEWRWMDRDNGRHWKDFAQPLWTGRDPLEGKTILLHAEQGLGDTLQFARYASVVAQKGARVWLAVPAPLASLMGSLKGVERVLRYGEAVPATDFHCPLLSLPLMLGTTLGTIPAGVPYLFVDSGRAKEARLKYSRRGRRLVGLCWRGNPLYQEDNERSVPFESIRPIFSVKGVQFVSLQRELTQEEKVAADQLGLVHPGEDFESTCAIVAAMDLVISVDTSWAHFAGAIGKPLWMLLSRVPHWVWLAGRRDSPWYPSARLFRQTTVGEWAPVMDSVAEELSRRRSSGGGTDA